MKLCRNTPSLPLPELPQGRLQRKGKLLTFSERKLKLQCQPCMVQNLLVAFLENNPHWLSPAGKLGAAVQEASLSILDPLQPSALWTTGSDTEAADLAEATPTSFSYLPPSPCGRVTTATGRTRTGGRNNANNVCSITVFHWVAKSFTINIVRDIKSMYSEGSSREEKAMLLTQNDPWICPGIIQLRKQSAFQVTDKFFPLNLYLRNSVN